MSLALIFKEIEATPVVIAVLVSFAAMVILFRILAYEQKCKSLQERVLYHDEVVDGIFSDRSFAYAALRPDLLDRNQLSEHAVAINEYFMFAQKQYDSLARYEQDAALQTYKERMELLERARTVLMKIGASTQSVDTMQRKTEERLREIYESLRDRAESDLAYLAAIEAVIKPNASR